MDRNSQIKQFIWNLIFWLFFFAALYLSYAVYFANTVTTKSKWVGLFSGAIAILLASVKFVENVYTYSKDTDLTKTINKYYGGLDAFFVKASKMVLFLIVFFFIITCKIISSQFAFAMLTGALIMVILNILNAKLSVGTSIREAFYFRNEGSFKNLFNSATISSVLVYGFICALSVIFYHLFKDYQMVAGFAFGISICFFVYSSTCVLVKKTTSLTSSVLNESEYRNDEEKKTLNFTDSIVKTIKPSLFLTNNLAVLFAGIFIAAISVGMYCMEIMASFLPIIIASNAIYSSILVLSLIRLTKATDYIKLFVISNIFVIVIFNIINYFTIKYWLPSCVGLMYSLVAGSIAGLIIYLISINKIFFSTRASFNITNAAAFGIKQISAQCLKEACRVSFLPCFLIFAVIIFSFIKSYGLEDPLMGIWGIILAVFSFVCSSVVPLLFIYFSKNLINLDYFSDVFEEEIDLSLISETGKKFISVLKKYVNFSVVSGVVAIILGYSVVAELEEIDLVNPYVFASLFLGLGIPLLFLFLCIVNVFNNSKKIVFEVKKELKYYVQVQENNELLNKKVVKKLSENVAVDFVFALGIILFIFFAVAIFMKIEAIGGLVIGILLSCVILNFLITNIMTLLKYAKEYLIKKSEGDVESQEFENLLFTNDVFAFGKDFISPLLNSLAVFVAFLTFALIPLLNSFM